ncbi:MAG TPA: ABC transporter permease [Thermoanaerobaculia bacterium]|nr:ABC transporter permease [Thermoanaerobaculia bacterium]
MREWWSKLGALVTRRRGLAAELDEEMAAHIALEIDENIARGMTPEAARAAARRHFGNVTLTAELARQAWSFPTFESLLQDLRYGLRGIRRAPGFSLVVILTLALGIGANTAIFSVIYSVLLRPLPYPHADRLVWLGESTAKSEGISVTWVNYGHWRDDNHSFGELAAFERTHLTLTGRDEPLLTRAGLVTSSFFRLLGMRPEAGRLWSESDERPGAPKTVVLSHTFWSDRLGHEPRVLGSTLQLDGEPYSVIGVAAPGYQFFTKPVDYYLPLALSKSARPSRGQHGSIRALGRLRPGVTPAAAQADLDRIMLHLAEADPGPENDHRAYATLLADYLTREFKLTLLILMAAVGLVLAIACANVASLVLARSTARAREMAIRAAIGGGRARLARQLLTENLLLAALGGSAGLVLAHWCLRALIGMGPRDIPRLAETALDWQVLLFGSATTILTGIVVGLAPLWTLRKVDLIAPLKDGSRSVIGASGARGGQSLRSVLVVAEIGITLLLVFTSALLLHSLIAAQTAPLGFDPRRLVALELVLPSASYPSDESRGAFRDRLTEDLRHLPGAVAAGAVYCPPSGGDCGDWFYSIVDQPAPPPGEVPVSLFNMADPTYFRTMHIPLRLGRGFADADRPGAPRVAIVNEAFARKHWPAESALGRRIKSGGPYIAGPTYQIVGVAGNVSQMGLDTEPLPEIFLPFSQAPSAAMVVMIRTSGDPASLISAARHRVREIDRNLPIQSLQVFEKSLVATLERRRFSTLLQLLFAALAIILAAVGVFGLLSYWVNLRENEIAIRMALGARGTAILSWVGAQALRLIAAGVALGAISAWAASHWLQSLVFGVSARSPATMAAAALAVIATAGLGAALPTWRATRVDAVRKLHEA